MGNEKSRPQNPETSPHSAALPEPATEKSHDDRTYRTFCDFLFSGASEKCAHSRFQEIFSLDSDLSARLFSAFSSAPTRDILTERDFCVLLASICGKDTRRSSFISLFSDHSSGSVSREGLVDFLVHSLGLCSSFCEPSLEVAQGQQPPTAAVASFFVELFEKEHGLPAPIPQVQEWVTTKLPKLADVLALYVLWRCEPSPTSGADTGTSETERQSVRLLGLSPRDFFPRFIGESGRSNIFSPAALCALHCMTPEPRALATMQLLYSDAVHGRSFTRFSQEVFGYAGPTLMLCEDSDGVIVGGYASDEWKEGTTFFGGPRSFLFRLHPDGVGVFRATRGQNFMFLNIKDKRAPRGIGFGGEMGRFRLFVDADFATVTHQVKCTTFATDLLGYISPQAPLKRFEIWGCGGSAAERAQRAFRQNVDETRESARKVDKAKMFGGVNSWKDNPDKHILELAGKTFYSDNLEPDADEEQRSR